MDDARDNGRESSCRGPASPAGPESRPAPVRELVEGFSLEMTGKDVAALEEAAPLIPPGTRINVTYLGHENLELRVAAAGAVARLGFTPVPHVSARRLRSVGELHDFLEALREVGAAHQVFAVGGDPAEPHGPYPDSLSLIRSGALGEYGVENVSIAGYPEGHPGIGTTQLWRHLHQKVEALEEFGLGAEVITQFGFDVDPVHAWVRQVRERGIRAPLRIGVPGPAGIKRLLGYAKRFGIGTNAAIVQKYGFSLSNLLGTAGPDRFVTALAPLVNTVSTPDVRLHLYTFGGLQATAEWARRAGGT